jgi:hypothetical protein
MILFVVSVPLWVLILMWVLSVLDEARQIKQDRKKRAAKEAERAAEEATPEWREYAEACRLFDEYPHDTKLWARFVEAGEVFEAKRRARISDAWKAKRQAQEDERRAWQCPNSHSWWRWNPYRPCPGGLLCRADLDVHEARHGRSSPPLPR